MKKETSYGIIPFRRDESGTLSFLLLKHFGGHWSFPKADPKFNESERQAALREFIEETNISNYKIIEDVTFKDEYDFTMEKTAVYKTVIYYLAEIDQNAEVNIETDEVSKYLWCDYKTALKTITFKNTEQILTEAYHYLMSFRT